MQVDASEIPGTITDAVLTFESTGSSSDNRARAAVLGVGYNNSTWTENMTCDNADKNITLIQINGAAAKYTTTSTSQNSFESVSFNILQAFQNDEDEDGIVTIIIYNEAADFCLIKNPEVKITYTTEQVYAVTFSETNGVEATVKVNDVDVTSGTSLPNGTYHYTATATGYEDYTSEFTVEGSDLKVEFTMTAKALYSYTVYAKADDIVLKTLASGESYSGSDVNYYYNQVLNYEGTLYEASAISSAYKTSFKLDENNKVVNHSYSQPATHVNNIVFLAEGEDVFTKGTGSAADSRCSMGAGGYASDKTEFVTLPAGTYKLVLSNRCSGARTAIHKFYKGNDDEPFYSADGYGYNQKWESEEFVLDATTTLYMQGGDASQYVDWLYIYCVEASATIGTTGYTTFSSAVALDLDKLPEGVTAYYASEVDNNNSVILLEEAKGKVEAGTGLIFSGEAKSYEIPVATSGSAIEGNKLVGCPNGTTLDADEHKYVLAKNSTTGQAEFQSLADNGATIPAGKAYLEVSEIASRSLGITFGDDDTTGIVEVEKVNVENGAIYNLNGQRVIKPTNGLYIMNGKKVIIK